MKLASYNIQYGKGKDSCFDLDRIVSELGDPDLIALQEVETTTERTGMLHQGEEIARRLDHMHWVYGPGIDVDASEIVDGKPTHRRRQFGNMVLSRWPILSSINHTLPKIALRNIFHLQRTLVETVIDAPSGPIRFCSVHLDHVSTDTRMPQVAYMRDLMLRGHERGSSIGGAVSGPEWADRPAPPQPMSAIVMGDMNFTPEGAEYTYLLGDVSPNHGRTIRAHGLADAWVLSGHEEGEGDTLPREGRAPRRIDHCFVTTDLADAVTAMEIGSAAQGSDHQPIFVTLDL
ncbi:endonuclease/exonuclease/phosphatase family protein [Salipiger sp. P9]|uniref:endonuclease/exonuclease/phosphatase family protein n=1 Tax=Salipiger pentaromativorans TaxID=2943193 RepID=UPI002157C830|nr:endonuclease/exonuclease/phosphatase family protein [Salipiger pentaromativorans]MCR8550865.1 endonuclease/exonuclease/phosphatase family protein [Salipiger pentaromativorans]